jgi:hypothetical protein
MQRIVDCSTVAVSTPLAFTVRCTRESVSETPPPDN